MRTREEGNKDAAAWFWNPLFLSHTEAPCATSIPDLKTTLSLLNIFFRDLFFSPPQRTNFSHEDHPMASTGWVSMCVWTPYNHALWRYWCNMFFFSVLGALQAAAELFHTKVGQVTVIKCGLDNFATSLLWRRGSQSLLRVTSKTRMLQKSMSCVAAPKKKCTKSNHLLIHLVLFSARRH